MLQEKLKTPYIMGRREYNGLNGLSFNSWREWILIPRGDIPSYTFFTNLMQIVVKKSEKN